MLPHKKEIRSSREVAAEQRNKKQQEIEKCRQERFYDLSMIQYSLHHNWLEEANNWQESVSVQVIEKMTINSTNFMCKYYVLESNQ